MECCCCMNILFIPLGLLLIYCIYGKWKHMHYKGTGVKYLTPPLPIFGNNVKMFVGMEKLTAFTSRMYNAYPDQKYIGIFEGIKPLIVLRDADLIKSIGVKDFDSFHNHRPLISEDTGDLFGKILFNLRGNKWREMRAALSPAFSSSKMKNMFIYIEQYAKYMSEFYLKELERQGKDVIDIEAKDTFSKYAIDTIATSAFGIEIDSLTDESNEFYKMGKLLSNFSRIQSLKMLFFITFPKLAKFFNISLARADASSFFTSLVTNSMKNREKNNIVRHDMINLLMEVKKGSLVHEKAAEDTADTGFSTVEESAVGKKTSNMKWTDDYLVAQAFLFFIGGFDTTSAVLSFFFYEISKNPDIQKKLHEEIDEHKKKSDNKFVYYDIQKLTYLDMCVSETLRLWPPAPAVDRQCAKTYTLPSPSDDPNISYEIKENDLIWLPIYAIHRDPRYYSDPERFDPERFSDENKHNIEQGSYIPFGIGPRNCIASRYALMVMKAIIYHILSNLEVVVTEKSEIPVQLAHSPFNLKSQNGIWVGLKKRSA